MRLRAKSARINEFLTFYELILTVQEGRQEPDSKSLYVITKAVSGIHSKPDIILCCFSSECVHKTFREIQKKKTLLSF